MDKTLGVSQVVSATNIESVIDEMKAGLVADLEQKKVSEVSGIFREARAKVRTARKRQESVEQQVGELLEARAASDADDRHVIDHLLGDINGHIRSWRCALNWGIALLVFGIGALPLLTDFVSGWWKIIALVITGLIAGVLGVFQLLDRPLRIANRIQAFGCRHLQHMATKRGLCNKLAQFDIRYSDGKFSVSPQAEHIVKVDLYESPTNDLE